MIIGREKEIAKLNELYHSGDAELIALYGRRRVGKTFLIDEVSMGLMPIMVNTCFDVIKKLNDSGITVLVVEQNANKALKIADRGYVLETGNIVISDTAENMRNNDTVQKAYLGG